MDRDYYVAFAMTARENFVDHGSGMKAFIEGEENPSISKSRLRKYKAGGGITVQPIEGDFHLIGFLDAIAWMARNGYIDFKKVEEESDISLELDDDADELERMMMQCVMTDAAMLEQFCSDVQCDGWDFEQMVKKED